jgi:glycosyltransferase involved in cell wall biosynthesis
MSSSADRVQAERELADWLLAPSEYVIRCLTEHGVPRERIVLLRYGADPEFFRPPAQPRRDGVVRVLFVGAVGPRKGIRYLLEAWHRLALPDAELVLVGSADRYERDLLQTQGDRVRWVDQASADVVRAWFQRSDIFAFPSLAEGTGLVTYEAMASGLPVVVTSSCDTVVRDAVDGFIVRPRDVDALAERILALYRDVDLRREMGAAGRRLIEEQYTWQHYRRRLAGLYRDVLEGHRRQPDSQQLMPAAPAPRGSS